jgi:hypothetical protein
MDRDTVGARHVIDQHVGLALRRHRHHAGVEELHDVHDAARVEGEIVGRLDRTAVAIDVFAGARPGIERGNFVAKALRDVQQAVGSEAHPVGAV